MRKIRLRQFWSVKIYNAPNPSVKLVRLVVRGGVRELVGFVCGVVFDVVFDDVAFSLRLGGGSWVLICCGGGLRR